MLCRKTRYKNRKIREEMEIKRLRCASSKSNVNRDDGIFSKQIHEHLCWEKLTSLKVHSRLKEALTKHIHHQVNFSKTILYMYIYIYIYIYIYHLYV